ncbi:hypothetical protein KI387_012167, partial [Taxus chinensis]
KPNEYVQRLSWGQCIKLLAYLRFFYNGTALLITIPFQFWFRSVGVNAVGSYMAPSWHEPFPFGMNDGSEFPAMAALQLPTELTPALDPAAADPARVQNVLQQILPLGVVPLNLANDVARALVFGIQSALALQS